MLHLMNKNTIISFHQDKNKVPLFCSTDVKFLMTKTHPSDDSHEKKK